MPNIKSVAKDVIRSRNRRERNNSTKSRIKTFVKRTQAAIAGSDTTALPALLSQTCSTVDKAAKRGIIHANAASRRKSRLMKRAAAVLKGA